MYWNPFLTPSVVVKKVAYDKLGNFDTQFTYAADWDMWVRVIYNLGGICIKSILTQYRIHAKSGSADLHTSGSDIMDFERIFTKFKISGYPLDDNKVRKQLQELASYNFIKYYYIGNKIGAHNMLTLYERNSTRYQYLSFVAKIKLRKKIGNIKRLILSSKNT